MRNIDFKVGYYEWLVLVDDEVVWVVSSSITDIFFEDDDNKNTTENIEINIEYAVESEIEIMLMTAKKEEEIRFDYNKELILSLTEEELKELNNKMNNLFKSIYL